MLAPLRPCSTLLSISTTGASKYKLNNRVATYSAYNAALIQHNILVKAKNFLVFQGDVEAVASQYPKELAHLIDQISGSLELAPDYRKAREALERATENATFDFMKRRGIAGEIKQYKEQKGEAERFEALCQDRVGLFVTFLRCARSLKLVAGRACAPPHTLQAVPHPTLPRGARAGHQGAEPDTRRSPRGAAQAR